MNRILAALVIALFPFVAHADSRPLVQCVLVTGAKPDPSTGYTGESVTEVIWATTDNTTEAQTFCSSEQQFGAWVAQPNGTLDDEANFHMLNAQHACNITAASQNFYWDVYYQVGPIPDNDPHTPGLATPSQMDRWQIQTVVTAYTYCLGRAAMGDYVVPTQNP